MSISAKWNANSHAQSFFYDDDCYATLASITPFISSIWRALPESEI